MASKEHGLTIFPQEVIQCVELLCEIDVCGEFQTGNISLPSQRLFINKLVHIYRDEYKNINLFEAEKGRVSNFCKSFLRYYESLLYNRRKDFSCEQRLSERLADSMAQQCFQQGLTVISNEREKYTFSYRLKQCVWLIAKLMMIARQEGIMALCSEFKAIRCGEMTDASMQFLQYCLELKINGYSDSSSATRLELKYLELIKDPSNNIDDLKIAYFIKQAYLGFQYGNSDIFWELCCDIGTLSNNELKQLYIYLTAAGVLAKENVTQDTRIS